MEYFLKYIRNSNLYLMRKIGIFILLCIGILSCTTEPSKKILIDSSGRMNHVLVVIDNNDWKGILGDSIRNILAKPVVGLPQPEPIFHLNQIDPTGFKDFLKATRNIIFVNDANKSSYVLKKDVYAKPQVVVEVKGKIASDIAATFKENQNEIINTIRNGDLVVFQKEHLQKNYFKPENVTFLQENGLSMHIPYIYPKSHDDKEYAWFIRDIPQGYLNILLYTVPITSDADIQGENIILERDKRGHYVPGAKEGMHIKTEEAFTPERVKTTIAGLPAYETRGKWYMTGDYMAGPFLNYTIVDKKNNRLIVAEGFTYAPNINKRNYMFELEAILKTLKVN